MPCRIAYILLYADVGQRNIHPKLLYLCAAAVFSELLTGVKINSYAVFEYIVGLSNISLTPLIPLMRFSADML